MKEAAAELVGPCSQHPVPLPRGQELKQIIDWVGLVCDDPSRSCTSPPAVQFCQRRQIAPDDLSDIPDDTVESSPLVLGGTAIPDSQREA